MRVYASALGDLGMDSLVFLASVVVVVPVFKAAKVSPVLGFLLSGIVLDRLHLFRDEANVAQLSELGVLFLLFEQGLELSFDRLKALAKYAFGLGLLQMVASTALFTAFELPVGNAVGTQLLTTLLHASPELVNIRSLDEAIVIGAGLSLSSSAFVLQLLAERGELATPYGRATLGVLLLQDIAVVPLLVVLPLYEATAVGDTAQLFDQLGPTAVKAFLGLGALLLGGRVVLRRAFELVAQARSTEAFVALCLLTVTGTGLLTQRLGFSDTLGAFLAGVLLAETNYRSQVEAEIRPFRGLLLGLFFVTTGTSIDCDLLLREWPNVLGLLVGLVVLKSAIVALAGPLVGLSRAESVRTGLLVGQGGEFAFVVFSLANQLGVLPTELNKLLIIVVVASMALTPALAEAGKLAAEAIERWEQSGGEAAAELATLATAPAGDAGEEMQPGATLVLGFGPQGQTVCAALRARQAAAERRGEPHAGASLAYLAFDQDPRRVQAARARGYSVLFGDASRADVLRASGAQSPSAVVVAFSSAERALAAVSAARDAFGSDCSVHARARNPLHGAHLRAAGASHVVVESLETGLQLASEVMAAQGEPEARTRAIEAALRAQQPLARDSSSLVELQLAEELTDGVLPAAAEGLRESNDEPLQ